MITKLTFLFGVLVVIDHSKAFRVFDVNGVETILATEKEYITIQCKADMPMAYCGFIHPTGKRFSFSGSTLEAGQCAIKIQASKADSGEWRCHIGGKGSIGVEVMQQIDLRVVQQIAALRKNITTVHGKPVTLACATTKGLTPLRYCRFEPPNGKPFSINSDVNDTKPILGRYYFPNNKSLDRGDCAVTIRKVKYEDVGTWTCGAGLDDGKEHIDTITVDVEGFYTMSTASATGITFGAIGIAAFLAVLGFIVWKKRRLLGSVPENADSHELRHLPSPQMSSHESREGSPHRSRETSPHRSRETSPHRSRETSPHRTRETSPQRSRETGPHSSRESIPHRPKEVSPYKQKEETPREFHLDRYIPQVVIESPSETSASPQIS